MGRPRDRDLENLSKDRIWGSALVAIDAKNDCISMMRRAAVGGVIVRSRNGGRGSGWECVEVFRHLSLAF